MSAQILALAGVFQATELVRQAARHGTWSGYAASASLDSLFRFEAEDVESVFGGRDRLRPGLETLLAVLAGENEHPEVLQHAIGLLQLQKQFLRRPELQRQVSEELLRISCCGADLPQHDREDLQAGEVAELYTRTLSTLAPRIVVNGCPQYLQNPRTVSWVRTLLFAGLRSAVLWRQLGGGRLKLLFGRRRLMEQAHELLAG